MIWKEVEEKYGKNVSEAMKNSKYLQCITCQEIIIDSKKEVDIPERDIELAFKDIKGEYINSLEWD